MRGSQLVSLRFPVFLVFIALIMPLLDGCSGKESGGASSVQNLPPDPGAAGMATLAGVDSDDDGVRDDTQRYIAMTYGTDPATTASLREISKALQGIIEHSTNAMDVLSNTQKSGQHMECLALLRSSDYHIVLPELLANVLNTDARSLAYIEAQAKLAGQSIPLTAKDRSAEICKQYQTLR